MDPAQRTRLEKLLGMLGSSFDGERANAARMIAAMAEKEKLTIAELIFGKGGASSQSSRQSEEPKPKPKPKASRAGAGLNSLLTTLSMIADAGDELEFILTEWECQFASDVSSRYSSDYELSEKQLVIVHRIIEKVERSGWGR